MRVIAGKYKGRKINPPVNNDVRPTTDKIKEALFDILGHDVAGATVIDLFAGTGALGIEALSRGAKKVYFCDLDGRSIGLVKSNLSFCKPDEYEVIKGDFADCIRRLAARGIKADIIICDPPYRFRMGDEILRCVSEADILVKGGAVTVERSATDEKISEELFFAEPVRKYGNTVIEVFRNYTKAAVTGTFDPFTLGHAYLVEKALEEFDCVYVAMLNNEKKTAVYPVEKRLRMAEIALRPFKKRVKCEYYDGMAVDYCKQRGIKYIIRGIRTPADVEYEKEMAEYNSVHGGVETIMVPSAMPEVSSTAVKDNIRENKSLDGLVDERIAYRLKKED